ncbi:hypothetical protein ScalyP_jg3551 [Parmales sp. scaly parma]|nr:hypothetical protein ScalyP_jg3551 [Parmales sp. scaly parma]
MLLIVLSPSKTQDYSTPSASVLCTPTKRDPKMVALSAPIVSQQKAMNLSEIKSQNKLSDKLGGGAHEYWKNYGEKGNVALPAVYAFTGAAYAKLVASTLSKSEMTKLTSQLRIIDPLQGYLRPSDIMEPYRLEMVNKLGDVKLQKYWSEAVTNAMIEEFKNKEIGKEGEKVLLNAASEEYFGALDLPLLRENNIKIVKASFLKSDGSNAPGILLKHARGLIARWAAQNDAETLEDFEKFDAGGYEFDKVIDNTNDKKFKECATIVFKMGKNSGGDEEPVKKKQKKKE